MLLNDSIQEGTFILEEIKAIKFLIEQKYGDNIPEWVLIDIAGLMNNFRKKYGKQTTITLVNECSILDS